MFELALRSTWTWMWFPLARSCRKMMYEPGTIQPVVQSVPLLAKKDPKAPTPFGVVFSSWKMLAWRRSFADRRPRGDLAGQLDAAAVGDGRARLPTLAPLGASTASPPAGLVNGSHVPARGIGYTSTRTGDGLPRHDDTVADGLARGVAHPRFAVTAVVDVEHTPARGAGDGTHPEGSGAGRSGQSDGSSQRRCEGEQDSSDAFRHRRPLILRSSVRMA